MSTDPDWALYRTLLAVLDEGSLSSAARRLGLAQPTVARHVDALEALLGADLFLRSQRGLQPTDPLAGETTDPLGTLHVEPGISADTIARLKAMGHKVEVVDDGIMFGGYQAIARDPDTGVYTGATEMRKDGQAGGY